VLTLERELKVGQVRRLVRLGTEAAYRVAGWSGDAVIVTVLSAPGLSAGTRLTFTRSAVEAMEVVVEEPGPDDDPTHGSG
jgi:hypothetical protein